MRKTDHIVIRMGAAHNEVETGEGVIPFTSTIKDPYHRDTAEGPKAKHVAAALKEALGLTDKPQPKARPKRKPKPKGERHGTAKGTDHRPAVEPGQAEHGPKRPRRRRRSRGALPVAGPGQP